MDPLTPTERTLLHALKKRRFIELQENGQVRDAWTELAKEGFCRITYRLPGVFEHLDHGAVTLTRAGQFYLDNS